jgi:hypothetical protein
MHGKHLVAMPIITKFINLRRGGCPQVELSTAKSGQLLTVIFTA